VPHRADHRHVVQFDTVAGVAQHQAAARHVTAADEGGRELQPLAEDPGEHVHVLRRRDAAQQHDVAVSADVRQQSARARLQGTAVARVGSIDVAAAKRTHGRIGHASVG
jgi:hypothetical protein